MNLSWVTEILIPTALALAATVFLGRIGHLALQHRALRPWLGMAVGIILGMGLIAFNALYRWVFASSDTPWTLPVALLSAILVLLSLYHAQATSEEVAMSEERFHHAFGNAPIGMAFVSTNGRFLQVNKSLCRMLGRPREELHDLSLYKLIHPNDLPAHARFLRQLRTGMVDRYELEQRLFHKDGHPIWTVVRGSLIYSRGSPRYIVLQVEDITERREAEQRLARLANYDPLTHLFNRRRFEEELVRVLQFSRRYQSQGTLLFLDLDQFKEVNDTLGHRAGDELLRHVATLLKEMLRESDVLARLGGDEFAIILPETSPPEAKQIAQRILRALSEKRLSLGGQSVFITSSIGGAIFPDHGTHSEELLMAADLAMYEAKYAGGNRFSIYSGKQQPTVTQKHFHIGKETIAHALKHNLFVLRYQPILDLRTKRVSHYEALLSMLDARGQTIRPAFFIPMAERFNIIESIDQWTTRTVLRHMTESGLLGQEAAVTINVSGSSFGSDSMLHALEQALNQTAIRPSQLVVEITETAAVANLEKARAFAERLRSLGVRLAVDDFGSGFASIGHLRLLRPDYLKIDGSYIKDLTKSTTHQHLVKAMVEMARGLEQQVIAEHVEDNETLALLESYGVDFAQGKIIGPPQSISAFQTQDPAAETTSRP